MHYLNTVDYIVMIGYVIVLVGMGFVLLKKASSSLEDYILGGRALPWWALGISGMASWLDVAGTMLIVSFLFILGPRGLFIEFRGGAGLLLPFMMLFVGKWMRRSQCYTPADWMLFRFGDGFGGRFAQLAAALGAIMTTAGMVAYLVKAIGLFLSMFLPFTPFQCALMLVGFATLYTMVSGFYGVVFTDIFQAGIIVTAVIVVSAMAISKIGASPDFAELAREVTNQPDWLSSKLSFQIDVPKGYDVYKDLFMFAMFYLANNIFRGMGFPGDPKYFGARNDRECGLLSFMWTCCMTFRWPLMISMAVMGIFLIKQMVPDQTIIEKSAVLVHEAHPEIPETQWPTLMSQIAAAPQNYPEVAAKVQNILGDKWEKKLLLVSYNGTINPERIMPAVMLFSIPAGLRGLLLCALIAASMSTFDSTVNVAAGIMIRDIYQKYFRPKAKNRELIIVTWFMVAGLVALGFMFAYTLKNVNEVWGWIVMGLGAGALVPGFLRLYWWRFNGGGFAVGTIAGMIAAVIFRLVDPLLEANPAMADLHAILKDERWMFGIILVIGLAGTILGTYLTKPEDPKITENFYRKTKPFGLWGPYKKLLSPELRKKVNKEHFNDIMAVPFMLLFQVCLFLVPMQLIIRTYKAFWITFTLMMIGLTGLYFFWYRQLPKANYYDDSEQ